MTGRRTGPARAPLHEVADSMAQQGNRQQSTRMTVTIVLLVLLALGFFAASFFVLV